MSTEDFTKRTEKVRKSLNMLRKDVNYRDEQEKRGEATYTLDAQINGQFNLLNQELQVIQSMANNFRNDFKAYNLTMAEGNRRYKVYQQLNTDKNTLKRNYDALFQQKQTKRQILNANNNNPSFDQKYDHKNLSNKELNELRMKQQAEQDEVLDEITNNVINLKKGGQAINTELSQQQVLLNNKMDGNTDKMSSARRRMAKLLDSSSNCCLISVLIIEIVAVVIIWIAL